MWRISLIVLMVAWTGETGIAAGRSQTETFAVARTGKERLSDKASDEQRVNDCKVPAARRTRSRSTECPWDAGS